MSNEAIGAIGQVKKVLKKLPEELKPGDKNGGQFDYTGAFKAYIDGGAGGVVPGWNNGNVPMTNT